MDFILHVLGLCPDHSTHFNITDLCSNGLYLINLSLFWVTYQISKIIDIIDAMRFIIYTKLKNYGISN